MASEQEILQKDQQLRSRLDEILPPLLRYLRTIRQFQSSNATDDEIKAQSLRALDVFKQEAKLLRTITSEGEQRIVEDLYSLVNRLHTDSDFKAIENNGGAANIWKYFSPDANGNVSAFFSEDSLINSQSLTHLYSYLNTFYWGIEDQIADLQKKATDLALAQRATLSVIPTSQPSPPTEKAAPTESASDRIANEARGKQQESQRLAKSAFYSHQLELINELLPPGRKLSSTDLQNISKIATDSSFSQLEFEIMLQRFGIVQSLGLQDSPEAMDLIREYIFNERQRALIQRKLDGLSTTVFPKDAVEMQEGITTVSHGFGDKVATYTYAASGAKLKELETTPDGKKDPEIATARRLREQSLKAVWDGPKGVRGLLDKATGRDLSRREQLLIDWNVVTREELAGGAKVPRLFEDFLPMVEDRSLTDLFGVPEEVVAIEPSTGEEAQPSPTPSPTRMADPAAAKRNLDNLKVAGSVSKGALTNPFVLGGAAIGGSILYGLVTQGVAGGLGVASSALAGAAAGGIIGSVVPGIGTAVGAFVGGVIGGIGGAVSIMASGSSSFAVSIGNAEIGLLGGAQAAAPAAATSLQAGAAGASQTLSAGVATGAHGAGVAANAGLAATQTFFNSMQTIPAALSGLPAGSALVAGPLIVTGVITIGIVAPAVVGSFLGPEKGLILESKYVTITKTSVPDQPQPNEALGTVKTISYKITVKPKNVDNNPSNPQYNITIKEATDTYTTSSKNQELKTPSPQDVSSFVGSLPPEGKDFSYELPVDQSYKDTQITNTFKITFDVLGTGAVSNQSSTGETSVTFGNPPILSDIGCFKFQPAGENVTACGTPVVSKDWSESDKQKMGQAFGITAQYKTYRSLLCGKGDVKLYRVDGRGYGGCADVRRDGSQEAAIVIYDLGMGSLLNVRYTIVHESGHIIAHLNGGLFSKFQAEIVGKESKLASYGYATTCPACEDFAETFAVFMVFRQREMLNLGRKIDMPGEYPLHYDWIKTNAFDGMSEPQ